MKFTFYTLILLVICLGSCKDKNVPEVSGIPVSLSLERFEQDLFALDTLNMDASVAALAKKYPDFWNDFLENIMGLPPYKDERENINNALTWFLSDYRPIYDSVKKEFKNLDEEISEIKKGLQFFAHYFPEYKQPEKLITFVGPMDAFIITPLGISGDAIAPRANALIAGLQLHLGSNFSMYHSEMGLSLYPTFISRKFTREYIPVNAMKNMLEDMHPDKSEGSSLIEQMVEKGKRMYILDKLMPYTPDTLKIGYTAKQLEGCYENEGLIWNFFLVNNLLNSTDPAILKNYIGEAPKTAELGDASPGFISLFCGWQIIKKYMDAFPETTLKQLLDLPSRKVYEESRYRPKA